MINGKLDACIIVGIWCAIYTSDRQKIKRYCKVLDGKGDKYLFIYLYIFLCVCVRDLITVKNKQ